jgi:myo-inositol catabolism protein IolS
LKQVQLGRNGQIISELGVGALQASGPNWNSDVSGDEIIQTLVKSYELGINFIDTAESYGAGHSEIIVGEAIKKIGRANLVVATKVGGQHLRFDELQKSCDASLHRLGIREIDLYQIHFPDPWEQIPLRHTFRALEKLFAEGKIRAIGVCNFAVRDLEEARSLLSRAEIISNQVRYNLLQRDVEEEVLPYCRTNGIRIIAHSPIAQGALGGKYNQLVRPSEGRRITDPLFSDHNMREIENLMKRLSAIGSVYEKNIPQVALNWLLSQPNVVPIPGAKNRKQAEENAGATGWRLSRSELDEIDELFHKVHLSYFP